MTTNTAQGSPHARDYRSKAAALGALVDRASPADWASDSPCEGWSATDVLDHMVSTQRDFLQGLNLDPGHGDDVPDRAELWSRHTAHVAGLLTDPQVADHSYDGYFGPTTVGETVAQFYGWDMLVHRWDIARAMNRDAQLSDVELDEIAAGLHGFGEALYTPGICAPALDVDPDAPTLVTVMALLGRDASTA